ncbi:MAG TPA: GNAT family N-acetyltransferase [Casimicrobiaceae bacterium]|jgi:phosphinothricin acetyltransferase|nr:GNAT family N-acetyltransferase [Casimicrobiaceae bacterium]
MSSGPVTVRPVVAGDLPAISAIYAHHVGTGVGTFELAPPDDDEIRRRWRDVVDRGLPYLVATLPERNAGIAGYAYASPYRSRPGYRYTVEDSVYVDPACMGQGAGRALLVALIAACTPLGYRQMVAVIGGSDNAASIGLHTAVGFERVGCLTAVGRKFDRWVDTVLMQRALGPGGATDPG